jgi:glycosyltransferase involved in cell wall biosynthesis
MSTPPLRHLGISLGLIDSLSDGLGEFSTQLCERIAAAADAWQREGVVVHLHMPERWHGRFGTAVRYLGARRLHGHVHWQGFTRFDAWHGLNQLGRTLPPWGTRRALLTVHDLNPIYADDPRRAARELAKLKRRLTHFDEVATLTLHVEGDIRAHLGWHGPLSVVPNGARDLTRHPQASVDGIEPGGFLFHLSRMAPSKNPQALLALAAHWPEQRFVFAGPHGPDTDHMLAAVREGGLANVRVLQGISDDEKAWLYAHCRGFVFPSLTEGFGLPPLEAMHFGKPVFLSNRTSLPEIGGDAAAYFTGFDPLAMRRSIESELPRLAANAEAIRAHAARFSWDHTAAAYQAIYRRLLVRT